MDKLKDDGKNSDDNWPLTLTRDISVTGMNITCWKHLMSIIITNYLPDNEGEA